MSLERELQVVILAGGLGTRLRPITETIPKPLVPICGRPFLEHQLDHLQKFGLNRIVLCVGYLGNKIKQHFDAVGNLGLEIDYSYESSPRGTAGALKLAEPHIQTGDFILMNGDTYSLVNFSDMIKFHRERRNPVTIVTSNASNPEEQELVEVRDELVYNWFKRGIPEHTEYLKKNPKPKINAGIYIINREFLANIPEGEVLSLERDVFPKFLGRINAFDYPGYIKDLANAKLCRELEEDIYGGRIR